MIIKKHTSPWRLTSRIVELGNASKIIIKTILLIIGLFLFSCTRQQEKTRPNLFAPEIVEAKGYVVPKDSIAEPKIIPAGKPRIINAGNPTVVPTNTNVFPAGKPTIILAGKPRIIIPGQDTFSFPKTVPAIDSSFVAGIPEVIPAKDAFIKDQNPQNFSSFSKLQGLKHGDIYCLLEDKSGNIWFGTGGGGVSKYDGKSFTHFTDKEGLSNNLVWSILEDKNGNIWFGTNGGGVSKYDGKNFTNFTDKEGLSNNDVRSMLEDKDGNLWFGTYGGGVSKYDGNRIDAIKRGDKITQQKQLDLKKVNGEFVKSFTHFTDKEGLSGNSNNVMSILEDKKGNLWFGTAGGGVSKYDGKSFSNYTVNEGLGSNDVRSMLEDKKGNIWFGTAGGGVSKYDGRYFSSFTDKEGLSNNFVLSMLEDGSGNLWFCTHGGGISKLALSGIDGANTYSFTHFADKEGLSNNDVRSVMEDKSGNIWFGTYGGGVSKYGGKSFTHFTDKEGLSNNAVLSILEDKSGNLWFGTYGGGASKYDGKSFTHYSAKEGLGASTVLSMLEDKNRNIWFGTYGGGVSKYDGKTFTNFTDKEGLSNNAVSNILEDKNGNIWFVTFGGGVSKLTINGVEGSNDYSFTHFGKKEGLSHDDVRCILEDKYGNLWFGTNGGGVSKLVRKEDKGANAYTFIHFTDKEGLGSNVVLSILEDKRGNIWFGTNGGGVSKYDGNRVEAIERGDKIAKQKQQDIKKVNGKLIKSFTHFTDKEGLSNNTVLSILEDKTGNIWFTTRFGLNKLSAKSIEKLDFLSDHARGAEGVFFKNYTYEDGFLGIGCNGNSICEDKNGTIWIGANDRLTAYHPDGDIDDTIAPNIQLTSLELFNENIPWGKLLYSSPAEGKSSMNLSNKSKAKDTSIVLGNGVTVGDFEFDGITKWYTLPENLSLAYNNNYLTFNFIGITQKQSKKVKYQYKLDGIDENWSAITNRTDVTYGNLPQGTYSFKVKAMNSEGYWSNEFNYTFTIRPPWWKTWWFRTIAGVFFIVLLYSLYRWRTASLRKDKEILEQTVEERTAEVLLQKEEAEKQREEAEKQKDLVEEKNKDILDSIHYAKRIQDALLKEEQYVSKHLPEHFILFKPKDIISGDFYWALEKQDHLYLAAVDCTGHGVPGAMMSMLGIAFLNEITSTEHLLSPAEILNQLRERIVKELGTSGETKDGMDISLLKINLKNNDTEWAGANNPIYIIKSENGEKSLTEIKGDKQPVGYNDVYTPFTNHSFNNKNCIYYIFTDGYADQFGGHHGKKFKYKPMQSTLISISDSTLALQKEILNITFDEWRGNLEQVDDVCLIGVRV